MKKLLLLSIPVFLLFSCKETEYSPEGPTDIRIENISDLDFTDVIIKTSEYDEDVDTIASIPAGELTEYYRFKKAYPKAEISTDIVIGDATVTFSTGTVDFTYMQYLSTMRVTFQVFISNMNSRLLGLEMIPEEELIVK